MSRNFRSDPAEPDFDPQELAASLDQLGVRELEQRLEFAPLLVDQSLDPGTQPVDMPCCVCKIGAPTVDESGMLPYPQQLDDFGSNI